jgi:hypothetical protein
MKNILTLLLLLATYCVAQKPAPKPASAPDMSGMYAFLHEGEFVEVDIDADRVTGFISRFGEADSDRGAFLDHMFSKGSFDGSNLTFATREVHGVSYEFKGKIVRGDAKDTTADGYYVLKGTLTETSVDANKKANARQREVELKSLPADLQAAPSKKD